MKERIIQPKKTTADSFSIPSLKQSIRGFGSQPSAASSSAVPDNSLVHDISRIPLRRPQTKLTINQPGDMYEQQADAVAHEVVGRLGQLENYTSIQRQQIPQEEQLQMKPLASSITPVAQRQEIPDQEEEEEEELQMKPLDNSTLQRESLPEEEEEEELQMKSLDNSTLQRESLPEEEEEEELQMKSLDNSTLQRESLPEEEEELQMKPMVQRRGEAGMAANPDLETSINQARGSGQPMADNIREPMEVAFGADFSDVKVHTDSQSDLLNQSIQARAFTTGQDVFFRQGEYKPGSRGGQELLAHELTHVVQQNGGAVQRLVQKAGSSNEQAVSEALPPYTETNYDSGILSGGGAIWEHIDFQDSTRISVKKKPDTGRFVYLDYRGGPFHGCGFSVFNEGYKAQEVKQWIRVNYGQECLNYWNAYRQNHPN
ncbi:MAG: DUF4157 domain-containing protein [Nostoc sp. DedSLP01]|nr:DUF4157 domain-containing protein [Nostoc sp. DedSLP05]MDZ8102028.1 DUF4157 domain-containing protein [Nostoc sp. DedSLP01]